MGGAVCMFKCVHAASFSSVVLKSANAYRTCKWTFKVCPSAAIGKVSGQQWSRSSCLPAAADCGSALWSSCRHSVRGTGGNDELFNTFSFEDCKLYDPSIDQY